MPKNNANIINLLANKQRMGLYVRMDLHSSNKYSIVINQENEIVYRRKLPNE